MARIIGNLKPEDDFTHELGPESNFNESMYFNFFDREQQIGGFVRIGNRANEGHAEMTVTLYLPDGRVLFTFQRAQIDDNSAMDAGGLRFEVLEPAQKLRTVYEGKVVELAEPREMTEPRKAFGANPKKTVHLDLVHDAVGPMYGKAGHKDEESRSAEEQFGKAHYEQHMHVTGTLEITSDEGAPQGQRPQGQRPRSEAQPSVVYKLDGYGLRDHSWGPRYWQAIESYEWLTLNFGPDLGGMISIIRRDADNVRAGGVLVRGDEIEFITEADIEADYEENGLFHKAVRARFKTQGGDEHELRGEVKSFIPLRNRRGGVTTHIGEGMTEWHLSGSLGDRVGYGLSEFLRTVK